MRHHSVILSFFNGWMNIGKMGNVPATVEYIPFHQLHLTAVAETRNTWIHNLVETQVQTLEGISKKENMQIILLCTAAERIKGYT